MEKPFYCWPNVVRLSSTRPAALKRLLNTDKREVSSSLESEMSSKKFDTKLTLLELRTISPEDGRIYLMT